jgi:hypothetical protein
VEVAVKKSAWMLLAEALGDMLWFGMQCEHLDYLETLK